MNQALPAVFIERLEKIIPAQHLTQVKASFAHDKDTCFRVNTLVADPDEIAEQLRQQGFRLEHLFDLNNAYTIPADQKSDLTRSEIYLQGKIYIQNAASMLPVTLLKPEAGERILDIAAAPGGKTLQAACLMQNQGWISAVELAKPRFFKLKNNIKEQAATIVHTYLMDGSKVWRKCPEQFDRIIADLPCSSESRFSLNKPESYAYWSEKKIKEMTRKQGKLLFSAIQSLKPGGSLIYSTCSFAPEENEQIIDRALKTFGDALVIESVDLPFQHWQTGLTEWKKKKFHPELNKSRRILPDRRLNGFYLCLLKKTQSTLQ